MEYLEVVEDFLKSYKNEDYFLGAILTGSYATGNNDDKSDIDIYVVTKDYTNWRERGNKRVGDYLIEYFINPKSKILSYMEEELKSYRMSTTMIFCNAKILYDKDGSVQELINIASRNATLNNLSNVDDYKYKMNCYGVWDSFDELEAKYSKQSDIDFSYYVFLQKIIDAYFYNNQIPSLPLNKLEVILKDEEFRRRYNVKKLPDQEFISLLIDCLDSKEYSKKMQSAVNIYNYYFTKFNDFDISNFVLRSDV